MRPLLVLIAAAITAASFATAPGPAEAGGRRHGYDWDYHDHWKHWRYRNPYFQYYERRFGDPLFGWKAHVRWCLERHYAYIPSTNLYVDSWGRRRRCNSPFD
jgi:hypothetical protein